MLTMQYASWEDRHGYYGDLASPLNKSSLGAFSSPPCANKPADPLIDSNNFPGRKYSIMNQWQSPVLPQGGLEAAGGSFATDPTTLFDDDHNTLLFNDPSSEEWNDAQPGSGSSDALDLMGEAALGSAGSLTQMSLLGGLSSAPSPHHQHHQQQLGQDHEHELQHLGSMHSSHSLHWSASGPFAPEEQHLGGPPAPLDSSTAEVPLSQGGGAQRRQVKKIKLADDEDAINWDSRSEVFEADDGYGSDEDYQVDDEEEDDDFALEGHLHTSHNGRKRTLGGGLSRQQPSSRLGVAMQSLNTGLYVNNTAQTVGAHRVGRPRVSAYKHQAPQLQAQQQPSVPSAPSYSDGDTGANRISRRLQQRGSKPFQGHLPLGDDFVTYAYDGEEPLSPGRASSPAPATARKGRPPANATKSGGSGSGAGAGRTAPGRRRTISVAAQRIRATSSRHELKGRPSFAEIVESGFMRPGSHKFAVGNVEVTASVGDDGAINYNDTRYRAISKFALVVLRERNPSRQSCDGWKEVAWNGEKLDTLRIRVQQHVRQQARRG